MNTLLTKPVPWFTINGDKEKQKQKLYLTQLGIVNATNSHHLKKKKNPKSIISWQNLKTSNKKRTEKRKKELGYPETCKLHVLEKQEKRNKGDFHWGVEYDS